VLAASPYESVQMPRFQLAAVAARGADAVRLAHDARLPGWVLASEQAMISPRHALRLWELAEHALGDPDVALTAAARHQVGSLDLFDYLFLTAATLREGLAASARYLPLLTTNGKLRVEAETERETTYAYSYLEADGRGAELALQLSVAVFCARAQGGTGRPVLPLRVGFAQPAPRSHRAFTETFGTRRIDFGAPRATFTFRAEDLDLPMRGADPVLAGILRRYAASLAPPVPASWPEHFRRQLGEAIEDGSASLDALARRLALSSRTLQRRLAEHGTTWRAELDIVRQRHARYASESGAVSTTRLARQLGYADSRSLRRARRRWDSRDGGAT
jgi:AraC-like DNA-binding protein